MMLKFNQNKLLDVSRVKKKKQRHERYSDINLA